MSGHRSEKTRPKSIFCVRTIKASLSRSHHLDAIKSSDDDYKNESERHTVRLRGIIEKSSQNNH